ncbi:MAG: heme-binding protein [Roseobacter sp.]
MSDYINMQATLNYSAATCLVAAAIEHAQANGLSIAVAVLDTGGHVVASGRMDGVPAPILEFATDKAFTSTLGRTSLAYGMRMAEEKSLELGFTTRNRLLTWEGGLPIRHAGKMTGAIGVSGAAPHEDAACAQAGIDALGLTP